MFQPGVKRCITTRCCLISESSAPLPQTKSSVCASHLFVACPEDKKTRTFASPCVLKKGNILASVPSAVSSTKLTRRRHASRFCVTPLPLLYMQVRKEPPNQIYEGGDVSCTLPPASQNSTCACGSLGEKCVLPSATSLQKLCGKAVLCRQPRHVRRRCASQNPKQGHFTHQLKTSFSAVSHT